MKSFSFGSTVNGLPIPAFRVENDGPEVLVLGGVHGDEYEGVIAAHGLLSSFYKSFPFSLNLTLVPALNLDGVIMRERCNTNGVDLNRNLPTKDWDPKIAKPRYHPGPSANSEPENQAIVNFLSEKKPGLVISLHSWKPVLNVNGECIEEAQAVSDLTGYKIDKSIGYPTPGCLGASAGLERDMPTITYEIERGSAPKDIVSTHVPAVMAALKIFEGRKA